MVNRASFLMFVLLACNGRAPSTVHVVSCKDEKWNWSATFPGCNALPCPIPDFDPMLGHRVSSWFVVEDTHPKRFEEPGSNNGIMTDDFDVVKVRNRNVIVAVRQDACDLGVEKERLLVVRVDR